MWAASGSLMSKASGGGELVEVGGDGAALEDELFGCGGGGGGEADGGWRSRGWLGRSL